MRWKEADLDNNGSIDKNEYILILSTHILEKRREAQIRCAWRHYADKDESGKVDKDELLDFYGHFDSYVLVDK